MLAAEVPVAISPDDPKFDPPLTIGQAKRLVINVLEAYGAAIVQRTPGLGRSFVQQVVNDVRNDLPGLVNRALTDAVVRTE